MWLSPGCTVILCLLELFLWYWRMVWFSVLLLITSTHWTNTIKLENLWLCISYNEIHLNINSLYVCVCSHVWVYDLHGVGMYVEALSRWKASLKCVIMLDVTSPPNHYPISSTMTRGWLLSCWHLSMPYAYIGSDCTCILECKTTCDFVYLRNVRLKSECKIFL